MSPGCGHTLASSNSDDFYSFDVKTIMVFFFHFVFFSSTHGGGQRTVLVVLTFCQGGSRDQTEVRAVRFGSQCFDPLIHLPGPNLAILIGL